MDFVSGAILGASLSTIWYPLNVIKTRMQSKVNEEFMSVWRTFNIVYNERGRRWRTMFRGVHLNFSRALISWGIINASYGLLQSMLHEVWPKSRFVCLFRWSSHQGNSANYHKGTHCQAGRFVFLRHCWSNIELRLVLSRVPNLGLALSFKYLLGLVLTLCEIDPWTHFGCQSLSKTSIFTWCIPNNA